jgi:hypothetical protein
MLNAKTAAMGTRPVRRRLIDMIAKNTPARIPAPGKYLIALALLTGLCAGVSGGPQREGESQGQPQGQTQKQPQTQGQNRAGYPFIQSVAEDAIGNDVVINDDGVYVLEGLLNTSIYRYFGSKTSLVIPDSLGLFPVWRISDSAFEPTLDTNIISHTITKGEAKKPVGVFTPRRTQLSSVTLPKELEEIGSRAFADNSLASVDIPETVKTIGSAAFVNNRISRITLRGQDIDLAADSFENGFSAFYNENEERAGYYMYGSLVGWSYLPLGEIKRTGDFTFLLTADGGTRIAALYSYSGKEKNVRIPVEVEGAPVTRIMYNAFYTGITGVSIPDSVTVIDNQAFSGNELKELTLPENLVTIGDSAFSNNKLTEIVIPRRVETIGVNAFSGNAIGSLKLDRPLIAIGDGAFQNNALKELVIPDKVKTIGANAFSGNKLSYVDIGSSVVSIGPGAFRGNQLESVLIPTNVESVEAEAFRSNPITFIVIGGGVNLGNQSFDTTFNAYYHDCFKLPGMYYKGNMRDRWSGGIVSKPHFVLDAGFGLEAGFGSAPWESSFFESFSHIGADARLELGLNFDLFSFNMSALGIGGTKFGKGIVGFYGGGMGELYLYDGFGLGFGGGVFYGSFEGLDIDKLGNHLFLHGEVIFRGKQSKFSLYGERYLGERWGLGLIWHVDTAHQ